MDISIVIATKGRVKLLIELLESIRVARDNYPFQSEVLLIDDSSEADRKRIEEACGLYDAKMYYYSPSVSGKRNFGVKMAVYDTILFWIQTVLQHLICLKNMQNSILKKRLVRLPGHWNLSEKKIGFGNQ